MALAQIRETVSVADYLDGEEVAAERHEYLAGEVHAMSGASARHNLICGNLFAALHRHLAGGPCRVFMADIKVRLSVNEEDFFTTRTSWWPAIRPIKPATFARNPRCW